MDNNLQALVNGIELNQHQKIFAHFEYTKLKQEHAEMVEMLEKLYSTYELLGLSKDVNQLLNKIKENGN